MQKHIKAIILLLVVYIDFLSANPFTGSDSTPAPINSKPPIEFIGTAQAQLHSQLGDYIYAWTKTQSLQTFCIIMLIAFFYGFIHALGPGHRKTIIFSYYLSKEAPAWEPLVTSMLLAALHGLTTITLLVLFHNVKGTLSGNTANSVIYLESISYSLLILLSIFSILHLLSHTFPKAVPYFHFGCGCANHTEEHEPCVEAAVQSRTAFASTKSSIEKCTTPHTDNTKCINHRKIQWGLFIISGLYPCPAALLVLLLVLHLNAFGLGIAAIISMSFGMTIPITAVAYLAWAGRVRLFYRIRGTQKYLRIVTFVLGIIAYSIILIFSLFSVMPVFISLKKLYS